MEKKTTTKQTIWSALSAFQQDCPVIGKSTSGYNYKYADLPTIMGVINPILAKHGLVLAQPIQGAKIQTILTHIKSGEQLISEADIPQGVVLNKMNQFQIDGSAITYYRRYALSSMLGIVTDEDTDASGEQVRRELPELLPSMKEWQDAITHLKNGTVTIPKIETKYKLSQKLAEKLMELAI